MSTKTKNNLSPVEKLRIKKARLKAEEQSHLLALDKNISYLQKNFVPLLMNTGCTVVKAQFNRNALVDQIIDILPVVFNGIKPVIISFVLRKIKNFIFK